MNKVTSYIKNVGKSIGYAGIDVLSTIAPSSAEFMETNADVFKELTSAVRNHRQIINRTGEQFKKSKLYEAGDLLKSSLFEDIQSGNFYNKERKDQVSIRALGMSDMTGDPMDGFNMDDSGSDDFDMSWDPEVEMSAGDKKVVSTIESSSMESARAISNSIARSTEYSVENQKSLHRYTTLQNMQAFGNMNSSLGAINQNLTSIVTFQNQVHKTHMENSKTYYETATQSMREQGALIKELVEMERNRYGKERETEQKEKKKKITANDVIGSKGTVNLKEYGNSIRDNFKAKTASISGMDNMFGDDSNILLEFVSSPLDFIPKKIVKEMMGTKVKNSIKEFDKSVGSFFGALITKFNTMAKSDNMLQSFFGSVFGIEGSLNRDIDTSKYEKGQVPWDGIARKSVTEVIPTYLRKILAALTGKNEVAYDLDKGKWQDLSKLKKIDDDAYDNGIKSKMSDYISYMEDYIDNNTSVRGKKKKEKLKADMFKGTKNLFEGGKLFDHNKSRYDDDSLGLDEESYNMFTGLFKSMSNSMQTGFADAQLQGRESMEASFRARENKSDDILTQLFNGSDITEFGKFKRTKEAGDKQHDSDYTHGIDGGSALIKTKDKFGNSIFDYLHKVNAILLQGIKVVVMGGSLSTTSQGGRGGRRGNRRNGSGSVNPEIDAIMTRNTNLNNATRSSTLINDNARDQRDDERHDERERRRLVRNPGSTLDIDALNDDEELQNKIAVIAARARQTRLDNGGRTREQTDLEKLSGWISENAREHYNNRRDTANREGALNSTRGFIDELISADNIFAKISVISDKFKNVTEKPLKIVTDILGKADQHMYEIIYGKATDDPSKPTGFIEALIGNMKDIFSNFNEWMDKKFLTPLSAKMSELGAKFEGGLKGMFGFFGVDYDLMKNNAKETANSFKGKIGKDIKTGFNSGKRNFLDVFKPAWYKFAGGNTTLDNIGGIASDTSIDPRKAIKDIKSKADRNNSPFAPNKKERDNLANVKATLDLNDKKKKARQDRLRAGLGRMIPPAPTDGSEDPYAGMRSSISDKKTNIDDIYKGILDGDHFSQDIKSRVRVSKRADENDDKSILDAIADISKNNKSKRPKDKSIMSKVKDEFTGGLNRLKESLFGFNPKDPKGEKFKQKIGAVTKDISEKIKIYAPDMLSKGLLTGLGFGVLGLVGGPITGLALGAGVSLVKNSDKLQDFLFGERGNDGKRIGTKLAPKKFLDGFEKYFPDMKKFGIAGGIASVLPFVPGGPLAGIMVGSAYGFAKNNQKIQSFLFGEDGGLLGPNFKAKLDKFIPKGIAGGIAGGIGLGLFGPFGVLGGAAIGAGLGLLSGSDKFNTAVFGTKDKNGKMQDGLIPTMRDHVIKPMKNWAVDQGKFFKNFFEENFAKPLKFAMKPITHEFKNMGKNILKGITSSLDKVFEVSMGIPLSKFVKDKVIDPFTKLFNKIFNVFAKIVGGVLTSPIKAITYIGNSLRVKHIKNGTAGEYASADEQMDTVRANPVKFLFGKDPKHRNAAWAQFLGVAPNADGKGIQIDDPAKPARASWVGRRRPAKNSTDGTNVDSDDKAITARASTISRDLKNRLMRNFARADAVNQKSDDSEIANAVADDIASADPKVKGSRKVKKPKAQTTIDNLTEQLKARDGKVNELEARVDKATGPNTGGPSNISPIEDALLRRGNHNALDIISKEVKGQLDGVGYNAERTANILAREFGDAPALGLKGLRGNRKGKGIFGKVLDFFTNPIKAFGEFSTKALFGADGKGGLLGGITSILNTAITSATSLIMAPFKMLAKVGDIAVAGFNMAVEAAKAFGPALARTLVAGVELFITTPLKVASNLISGLAKGMGSALEHVTKGLGAVAGSLLELTSVVPSLIKNFGDLTVELGKFTIGLVKNLSETILGGLGAVTSGISSLMFKSVNKLKMGVYITGGKLDEVKVVDTVNKTKVIDLVARIEQKRETEKEKSKAKEQDIAANVATIASIAKEEAKEQKKARSVRLPMAAGAESMAMPTEEGLIRFDTDASGVAKPIKDEVYKASKLARGKMLAYNNKVASTLTATLEESKKITEHTSFLTKLGNGFSGLLGMLPMLAGLVPFLIPVVAPLVVKALEVLGFKDSRTKSEKKDNTNRSIFNALSQNRVVGNMAKMGAEQKVAKDAAKLATESGDGVKNISKLAAFKKKRADAKLARAMAPTTVLDDAARAIIPTVNPRVVTASSEALGRVVIAESDNVVGNSLKKLFSNGKLNKAVGKEVVDQIVKKLPKLMMKSMGKTAFKAALGTFGRLLAGPITMAAFAIYDFTTGMADAENLFKTSKADWTMRLVAGLTKVLNAYIIFGLIPLEIMVGLVFSIVAPMVNGGKSLKTLAEGKSKLQDQLTEYNAKNNANLTLDQFNDKKNTTVFNKAKNVILHPIKSTIDATNWAVSGAIGGAKWLGKKLTPMANAIGGYGKYLTEDGVMNVGSQFRKGVTTGVKGGIDNMLPDGILKDMLMGGVTGANKILGLGDHLRRKLMDNLNISDKITELSRKGLDGLSNIGKGFKTFIDGAGDLFNKAIKPIADTIDKVVKSEAMKPIVNVFNAVGDMAGKLGDWVKADLQKPINTMKDMWSATIDFGNKLGNIGANVWKAFDKFFDLSGYFTSDENYDNYKHEDGKTGKTKQGKGYGRGFDEPVSVTGTTRPKVEPASKPNKQVKKSIFPFFSQKDQRWTNMRFNSATDKIRQTIGDSGCGPTAESMVVSALTGKPITPDKASSFATRNRHKENDGGTKFSFFKSFGAKNGLDTDMADINSNSKNYKGLSKSIMSKLRNNIPVILMGKDGTGSSPFGSNPHYVVATGVDKNGNIIINNPEESAPGQLFSAESVLSKSSKAIWHTNKGKGFNASRPLSKDMLLAMTKADNTAYTDSSDGLYSEEKSQSLFGSLLDKFKDFASGNRAGGPSFDGDSFVKGKLGVHDWFGQKISALAQSFGKTFTSVSGYRSAELQQKLWDDRKRKYPNEPDSVTARWVARPGRSRHQAGLAIDAGDSFYKSLSNSVLAKFGLHKPLSNENWHIEPLESKGRTTEALIQKYGVPGRNIPTMASGPSKPLSKHEFIKKIAGGAINAFKQDKILPSITIAQAILESGWGKHGIGNNIFGIKAGKNWKGKTQLVRTAEDDGTGRKYYIDAPFRDYASIDDAILDHSKILTKGSVYKKFRAATNYTDAARALQGTYATDTSYASQLTSIIKSNGLDKLDNPVYQNVYLGVNKATNALSTIKKNLFTKMGMGSGPATTTTTKPPVLLKPKVVTPKYTNNNIIPISNTVSRQQPRKISQSPQPKKSNNSEILISLINLLVKIVDNTKGIDRIVDILSTALNVNIPKAKANSRDLPVIIQQQMQSNTQSSDTDITKLLALLTELAV